MTGPRYTPLARSLPASVPFVGPEEQERARGAPFLARLGANENIFGASPKAIEAMRVALEDIWKYGDPTCHDLRQSLARHHGIAPENIVIGEGIDALLGYLVRLVVAEGDAVVTSDGAYPTFSYHVTGFGGRLHKVPYRDDREDLPALVARAAETGARLVYLANPDNPMAAVIALARAEDAALIYFANPDNPMGSWHEGAAISAALDMLPEGCLLVLDEAYVELAPEGTAPEIDAGDPRVIRMRTFSKAHGLAGARIGYAIAAAPLIRSFDKIRNHFGVNRVAQAGALAALKDRAWLAHIRAEVAAARDRIGRIAARNGLVALPSAANFVAVDCGGDGRFAGAVLERLVARGIFVRMPFAAPQNRAIRISCGPPEDLARLARALPEALAEARKAGAGEEMRGN